ncbi:MAG: response regulator transcription factor [Marinilabiliales bacterium]
MSNIQIVIVDDHDLILNGIKTVIDDIPNIRVIGEANNGKQLFMLLERVIPDVIIMDIDMPVMDCIETTKIVKNKHPEIHIIALTIHDELGVINKIKEADFDGYLLKNIDKEEISRAIKIVNSGKKYYSANLFDSIISQTNKKKKKTIHNNLTDRDIEVLKLIANGFSNKEIGQKLYISHRTVDTHRTNIMKKLSINNIAGLIKFAYLNELLD